MFETIKDFILEWQEEFIIFGVALILIILLTILFFKPRKNKKVSEKSNDVIIETDQKELDPATTYTEVMDTKDNEKILDEVEKEEEVILKKDKINETVYEVPQKTIKQVPLETKQKEESQKIVSIYHISQNKDNEAEFADYWRIRKEGVTKTLKYFKSQKEAIDYTQSLLENQNGSIIIHKRDGSIRKQDYKKKK